MSSRLRATALAFACLGVQLAHAAPPPAELFFKDPDIEDAVLSPSGRKLAVTSAKGVARVGLAVLDLGPGNKITRVAQFSNGDIYDVAWLDEDRLIFGTGDVSRGTASRFSSWPTVYTANSDGSKVREFAQSHLWLLQIPEPAPGQANDEILMGRGTGIRGEMLPVWASTRGDYTRAPKDLNAPPHTVGWLADSRGELRVAFTLDNDKQAAFWRGPGSTTWTKLYEGGLLDASTPFDIAGVDDVGGLYVTHSNTAEGYRWLSRYDFQAGKPEDKFIVETPGFDFDGSLVMRNGKALGVRLNVDAQTTIWFDPQMKALQAQADQRLPGRVNHISCRRCGEPDMVALVRSSSDHDPGRLFLYQAKPPEGEKGWRSVGPTHEGIDPVQMASMDLHRIKARDGRDLPVWITRPDTSNGPLPAVVLVHGGPWLRGSHWGWHALPQFLASRGYVVIEPEMRGSTGYGKAHYEAGFKQWGQAMQNDVADALRWAQAQGLATSKACIAGTSYGGYSALMGLVNDPDLFRCGIAGLAPTDLEVLVAGSWLVSDDIGHLARKYTLPELVGDAKKDATMLAAQSPVKQAARIKAPLMLMYGERDRRVPLEHGERMRDALRKGGNDPVWVTYDNEGHGLGSMKNRLDYAKRLEVFLAKHLAPTSP
jgi:dipeptidyl aminopeptidase/acylaminoacyl peptidase